MDNPLGAVKTQWKAKIELALKAKKSFQDDADQGMRFFNGPYDFLYGMKRSQESGEFIVNDDNSPRPSVAMTVNKVAEAVQIFGPSLYHRNPIRKVNPREFPMLPPELFGDVQNDQAAAVMFQQQQMQAMQGRQTDAVRAMLLSKYLNYTPEALGLKHECRRMVDEAIIKGMGLLWHEVYKPAGSDLKMVGSFFDSVDNLVIDPDMRSIDSAKWVARRCCHPIWQVEAEYNLPPGTLKGQFESGERRTAVDTAEEGGFHRRQGKTNDLVVYWKVWSKMGIGGLLSGMADEVKALDRFGPFCYLVVADGLDYPLNVPPEIQKDDAAMQAALQWETPFWADDAWPFTPLIFHEVPDATWPMSHFKPGMGELKFINWAYSFVASKIKKGARDIIAVLKEADDEVRRVLVNGTDYEILKLSSQGGKGINELVQFLQHPPFHMDLWTVIRMVEQSFEKRVGLSELMYGMSENQMRSASEANVKSSQLSIRPDDMANKVEDTMSRVARAEAIMARWHLEPQDVAPVIGPTGAQLWQSLVSPSQIADIIHGLEYRIEAGSAKKPNKDKDVADANASMQTLFQPFFQLAMSTGQVGPVNALIQGWCKANDREHEQFMIQPPPPPPMPAPGAPPGAPQGGPPQ